MTWTTLESLPSHLAPLGVSRANRWQRIYEALRAGGADQAEASARAWVEVRSGRPERIQGMVAAGGVRLDRMQELCRTYGQETEGAMVEDLNESGRRNSAEDRQRIATIATSALDQMDDQQYDDFVSRLHTRERTVILQPREFAAESDQSPAMSATSGRVQAGESRYKARLALLNDRVDPHRRRVSAEERMVDAVLRGRASQIELIERTVAGLRNCARVGRLLESNRLAASLAELRPLCAEAPLRVLAEMLGGGATVLGRRGVAACLDIAATLDGVLQEAARPDSAAALEEAKRKMPPAFLKHVKGAKKDDDEGDDDEDEDETETEEAMQERLQAVTEAGKKRIKGNLCTGSGGFQACSTTSAKRGGRTITTTRDLVRGGSKTVIGPSSKASYKRPAGATYSFSVAGGSAKAKAKDLLTRVVKANGHSAAVPALQAMAKKFEGDRKSPAGDRRDRAAATREVLRKYLSSMKKGATARKKAGLAEAIPEALERASKRGRWNALRYGVAPLKSTATT